MGEDVRMHGLNSAPMSVELEKENLILLVV
jgi:hypothetical protein